MKTLLESILNKSGVGKAYQIQSWLDEHGVKNYTINNKGEIDVNGNVNLSRCNLTELPPFIQFGTVNGFFNCSFNGLVSLRGVPNTVGGRFNCSYNSLKSLEGAPKKINGSFFCNNNNLETLKGSPEKVGGRFNCRHNRLISLEGSPSKINEYFDCSDNKLKSLEGAPKEAGYFSCSENSAEFTEDDVKKVCKVKYKIHV